jgi:hypothetical protein
LNMDIKPIETVYKVNRFRSRLEAKWAVFFDELKIKWEYEPEGYVLGDGTWYLPDFFLPELECFAEVKAGQFTKIEFAKCEMLSNSCLLLDGRPETFRGYYLTKLDVYQDEYKAYIRGDNYGRVILGMSGTHKRLWFLWGEEPKSYWIDTVAEVRANQYRFGIGGRG